MRLNPWFSKENHERELTLLGHHFGQAGATQNTVFCLFEPDAPGLSADAFPTEDSIFFGTRPGKRYPFIPQEIAPARLLELITEYRKAEAQEANPDQDVLQRIAWEYQNVKDGDDLARVMAEMIEQHPAKPESREQLPVLPVMPDLTQAINIAAADSRGVIALIEPEDPRALADALRALAFEEGIAGRAHLASVSPAAWEAALDTGLVTDGSRAPGIVFIAPDPFGLEGRVWTEIAATASRDEVRTQLLHALDRFHREWRKLDRGTHLSKGCAEKIVWSEYNPTTDEVEPIPIVPE